MRARDLSNVFPTSLGWSHFSHQRMWLISQIWIEEDVLSVFPKSSIFACVLCIASCLCAFFSFQNMAASWAQMSPYNWSEQLYQRHGIVICNYLAKMVLPALQNQDNDVFLLQELTQRWFNHQIMNKWMHKVFMYLDRWDTRYFSFREPLCWTLVSFFFFFYFLSSYLASLLEGTCACAHHHKSVLVFPYFSNDLF